MAKNLYSLGLLRNGKVYANKQQAVQGLMQEGTNDGVAKLSRYLYTPENSNEAIIRTIVGFYANADEMENNGGGISHYTVLDIEGSAADVNEIRQEIEEINSIIGDGIDGKTLTEAINEVNSALGNGFTSAHTVADALQELEDTLTNALEITLDIAGVPTSGYLMTYELKQGGELVGKIDIPKDKVVTGGSLVHGTWNGDVFTEDPNGKDTAIKIVFANSDTIYINTSELVDVYTAGNGISIDVNRISAVAAQYSATNVNNPITVDEDGIKFASMLDCGYFDD